MGVPYPGKILSLNPSPGTALIPGQVPRIGVSSTEPHLPHVLVEKGDMTLGEFMQHLQGRADFIKGMKKDRRAEHKVSRCWTPGTPWYRGHHG